MFTTNNYAGCGHSVSAFDINTQKHIKIEKVKGTWSIIGHKYYPNKGIFFLCEHDTWGDEVACVIIDAQYNMVLNEAWNGFLDLEEKWDWENFEKEMFSVLQEKHFDATAFDDGTIQRTTLYKVKFDSKTYEVMVLSTTTGNLNFLSFYYQGNNRPNNYGILEEKLEKYYRTSK